MTVHFVHPEIFNLTSLALACKCFSDAHTGQEIARKLIFRESEILSKVINAATYTASNFTKAFSLFSQEACEHFEVHTSEGSDGDDEVGEFLPNVERDRDTVL